MTLKNFLRPTYSLIRRALFKILPPETALRLEYWRAKGENLSFKSPKTIWEKIQWIKLYDRNPLYTTLADKYAARDYVEQVIGKQYLVKLYGVYEKTSEIDWDVLPSAFILKTAHGCGHNILVADKKTLDKNQALKQLDAWLRVNLYYGSHSWAYKNIPPRIICEELLVPEDGRDLVDYKIHCMNGEPRFCQVIAERYHGKSTAYYDLQWNRLPFHKLTDGCISEEIPRPSALDEMVDLARKLSKAAIYMRVDFYFLKGQIIFGEMTLYPTNGLAHFDPPEYNLWVGEMLTLPAQRRCS